MLIPNEELFDPTVFKLNDDLVYETIDTSVAKITIIDDFYEDIDSVLDQIDKLPTTMVWRKQPNINKTHFDGRKVYANNMTGSELRYTEDCDIINLTALITGYSGHKMAFRNILLVNCFQFTDDLNLQDNYYGAHLDPYEEKDCAGQLAIVLFLNRHYEEGEGMNFYSKFDTDDLDDNNMVSKDKVEVVKTIQGQCNRAVLFDSKFPHGQHTPTDQFKKEMRHTQVIFLSLW